MDVGVGVGVAVGESVGVGVGVFVGVRVGVSVGVTVGVRVAVGVGVLVGVSEGVNVGVGVGVNVGLLVGVGFRLKRAVTLRFEDMAKEQDPVPEQPPPDQPAKLLPEPAAAVKKTVVPSKNPAEQVPPQLIPAGEEVTVPEPDPVRLTVSV